MNLINVKCPNCGYIFEANSESPNTNCVNCKNDFPTEKGSKFYKSFKNVEVDKFIVNKGETYLKVDSLLDKIEFYLDNEEFENAIKLCHEALELTKTNYRVYISLVYAYTENFKNLQDEEHVPYLKKAIALASDEQKKQIKSAYSNYYKMRKMTDAEKNDYIEQEEAHLYNSLEKLLKDGLPRHFIKEKRLKPLLLALIILSGISVLFTIPTIVFENVVFYITLFVLLSVDIVLLVKYFSDYSLVKIYNLSLDIFDAYNSFNIDKEKSVKILNQFLKFAISYVNNSSDFNLKNNLDSVITLILENSNDTTNKFFTSHKELKKYI